MDELLEVERPVDRQIAVHPNLSVRKCRYVIVIGKLICCHIRAVKPMQGIDTERHFLSDARLKPLGF